MNCAIYCRLSKEDETVRLSGGESESIQNQKALLEQYAAEQGWGIYRVYSDEDYSGADSGRPQWRELLEDARNGNFQAVLCKTQSRFTRDMEMVEKYIHGLFPLWGIRFIAILDNVDTQEKGNKKARQINGLINEWYLEDLSENIKAVFAQKRKAGRFIGSFAPYGYQKDPDDRGRLVVDPVAAGVVREIFRYYLEGKGTHAIARDLENQGVPSPGEYKRESGQLYQQGRPAGGWTATTVSRILHSEVYIGNLVQGVREKPSYKSDKLVQIPRERWVRVENTHQAIVSRELFELAQKRLGERTRSGGLGESHPLAGKVRCADCGGPMVKCSSKYKGERRSYLQCARYAANRNQPACTRHSIRLDRLLAAIEDRMEGYLQTIYQNHSWFQRDCTEVEEGLRQTLKSAYSRRKKLSAGIHSIYLDKVDGVVTPQEFAEILEGIQRERDRLDEEIKRLEEKLGGNGGKGPLPLSRPYNRQLYDLLICSVEVGEREELHQPVKITWNF